MSDLELVKLYCRYKINKEAIALRRSGATGQLGDKYIVRPIIRQLEECLDRVGLEDFFNQDIAVKHGLTSGGLMVYATQIMVASAEYAQEENFIGRGWRN